LALQALKALNSITPKDIGSLKALKNPPDIVKRIFDSVLLLRFYNLEKPSWQEVKGANVLMTSYDASVKMMSDSQFLSHLMNFPKEQINDETVELLQPYFSAPDFNYESAAKASGNVAGLCNWAEAMCQYHKVAVVVEPKIQALHEAEAELKVANKCVSTLEQAAHAHKHLKMSVSASVHENVHHACQSLCPPGQKVEVKSPKRFNQIPLKCAELVG
jgi:dynein heavy chain, axonemal